MRRSTRQHTSSSEYAIPGQSSTTPPRPSQSYKKDKQSLQVYASSGDGLPEGEGRPREFLEKENGAHIVEQECVGAAAGRTLRLAGSPAKGQAPAECDVEDAGFLVSIPASRPCAYELALDELAQLSFVLVDVRPHLYAKAEQRLDNNLVDCTEKWKREVEGKNAKKRFVESMQVVLARWKSARSNRTLLRSLLLSAMRASIRELYVRTDESSEDGEWDVEWE